MHTFITEIYIAPLQGYYSEATYIHTSYKQSYINPSSMHAYMHTTYFGIVCFSCLGCCSFSYLYADRINHLQSS